MKSAILQVEILPKVIQKRFTASTLTLNAESLHTKDLVDIIFSMCVRKGTKELVGSTHYSKPILGSHSGPVTTPLSPLLQALFVDKRMPF